MRTTRPTLAPESTPAREPAVEIASALVARGPHQATRVLFFDDLPAVMYRKIDTTPRSAKFLKHETGLIPSAGLPPSRLGLVADFELGSVVSSFIFSRMTHRLASPRADATDERMNP
jgi:hypothetical protein